MNRSQSLTRTVSIGEINKKIAIHEAGHATAIYLGNRQKRLPPVYFQIIIDSDSAQGSVAKIEGGRLIHTLPSPSSLKTVTSELSLSQKQVYQQAFESDIINLLVGPLAEANYIAQRDGEIISPRLVNLNALHFYGGSSDLAVVHDYLHCFIATVELQEKKIAELFLSAFDFIGHWPHWLAITALADCILAHDKQVIDYEEIAFVLETHFLTANKRLAQHARF